jgi:hypothetical protein
MSLININLSLDRIDKSRIIEKNGKKYLNLTIASSRQTDQYGNTHQVYHTPTKEEREARANKIFCGNGKEITFNNSQQPAPQPQQSYTPPPQTKSSEPVDDLPF